MRPDDIWVPTINSTNVRGTWWRHQMETFSALLALCAGNSPVPVNSPHKGQWRGALMFSLICARINEWVSKREAGDLRRYRRHYDVNLMFVWVNCAPSTVTAHYVYDEQVAVSITWLSIAAGNDYCILIFHQRTTNVLRIRSMPIKYCIITRR